MILLFNRRSRFAKFFLTFIFLPIILTACIESDFSLYDGVQRNVPLPNKFYLIDDNSEVSEWKKNGDSYEVDAFPESSIRFFSLANHDQYYIVETLFPDNLYAYYLVFISDQDFKAVSDLTDFARSNRIEGIEIRDNASPKAHSRNALEALFQQALADNVQFDDQYAISISPPANSSNQSNLPALSSRSSEEIFASANGYCESSSYHGNSLIKSEYILVTTPMFAFSPSDRFRNAEMERQNPDVYGFRLISTLEFSGDVTLRAVWTEEPNVFKENATVSNSRTQSQFDLYVVGKSKPRGEIITSETTLVGIDIDIDGKRYTIQDRAKSYYPPTGTGVSLRKFALQDGRNLADLVFRELANFSQLKITVGIDLSTNRLGQPTFRSVESQALNGETFRDAFQQIDLHDENVLSMVLNESCERRQKRVVAPVRG